MKLHLANYWLCPRQFLFLDGWMLKLKVLTFNHLLLQIRWLNTLSITRYTRLLSRWVLWELTVNGRTFWKATGLTLKARNNSGSFSIRIENPKLWWPNGLGKQNLYNLSFRLGSKDKLIEQRNVKLGLRDIKLVKGKGSFGYEFLVNHNPLFIKGVEWNSLLRASNLSVEKAIGFAKDMNINFLYVSESVLPDEFYQLCDESGILVGQTCNLDRRIGDYDTIKTLKKHSEEVILALANSTKQYSLPKNQITFSTYFNVPTSTSSFVLNSAKIDNVDFNEYYKANYSANKTPVYKTIARAEYLKDKVERNRLNMPGTMGVKLSVDTSDVNSFNPISPIYHSLRKALNHIIVKPVLRGGNLEVYSVSDAFKNMDAILLVKRFDFNGNVLYTKQIPVNIPPNSSALLISVKKAELNADGNTTGSFVFVQLNQPNLTLAENLLFFCPARELNLKKGQLTIRANATANGFNLILRSPVLLHNLCFETRSGKAVFLNNDIDLLPNTRTKIPVLFSGTKKELLDDLTYYSLNDFD